MNAESPKPDPPETRLVDLPHEILLEIFSFVASAAPRSGLVSSALTCRRLKDAAYEVLWDQVVVSSERGLLSLFRTLLNGVDLRVVAEAETEPLSCLSPKSLALFSTTKVLDLSAISLERIAHWPSKVDHQFQLLAESVFSGQEQRISPSISNAEYLLARLIGLLILACHSSLVQLRIPRLSGRYLKNEVTDILGLVLVPGGKFFPNLKILDLTPSPGINDGVLHLFLAMSPAIDDVRLVCMSVPGITLGTFPVAFRTSGLKMKMRRLKLVDRRYIEGVRESAIAEFVEMQSDTLEALHVEGMTPHFEGRLFSNEPGAGLKSCVHLKELTISLEKYDSAALPATLDEPTSFSRRFTEFLRSPDLALAWPELWRLRIRSGMSLTLFQLYLFLLLHGRKIRDLDLEDFGRAWALLGTPTLGNEPDAQAFGALDSTEQAVSTIQCLGPKLLRFQTDGSALSSSSAVNTLASTSPRLESLNLSNPVTGLLDNSCLHSLASFSHLHRLTLLQPAESMPILGETPFPFNWLQFLRCLRTLFFEKSLCHAILGESCTHHGDLIIAITGKTSGMAAEKAGIIVKHLGFVVARRRRDVILLDWSDELGVKGKGQCGKAGACSDRWCQEEDEVLRLSDTP